MSPYENDQKANWANRVSIADDIRLHSNVPIKSDCG